MKLLLQLVLILLCTSCTRYINIGPDYYKSCGYVEFNEENKPSYFLKNQVIDYDTYMMKVENDKVYIVSEDRDLAGIKVDLISTKNEYRLFGQCILAKAGVDTYELIQTNSNDSQEILVYNICNKHTILTFYTNKWDKI